MADQLLFFLKQIIVDERLQSRLLDRALQYTPAFKLSVEGEAEEPSLLDLHMHLGMHELAPTPR